MVDVLIAGAGPAGSVAALLLARAGARVLLVDRARFPRDKPCGDTVNPGALAVLERAGLRARVEAASRPLEGMLLTDATGITVRGTYGRGRTACALTRRRLDALLVGAAVEAGARFEEGLRVRTPLVANESGRIRVRGALLCTPDGREHRAPARLTIAADGRRSALAFGLGLASQPKQPRRWAIGAYFEDVAGLDTVGEMHVRGGHYIGVAPLGAGLANATLVTPAGEGFADPGALLRRRLAADPLLAERFAGARLVSPVTTLGPLAVDVRAAGVDGLLLAGDAAGFIDPMTGDGLRLAMRGAELAAEAAAACLADEGIDGAALLARRRTQEFGVKMRVNRVIRGLVASPGAVRAAALGARLAPGVFRQAIRYAGDVWAG